MADARKPARKHAVILSGGGAHGAYEIGVMKALFGGHVELPDTPAEDRKIDPSIFAGTSVGAFSAAFMASRPGRTSTQTLGELEGLWRNRIASTTTRANGVFRVRGNVLEFLDPSYVLVNPTAPPSHLLQDGAFFAVDMINRTEMFFRSKEDLSRRLSGLIDFSALVSIEPLRDLVTETIDLQQLRGNEERALFVAATNWEKGETETFTNRKPDPLREKQLDDKTGHLAIMASTAIPGIFPPVEIHHTKYVDGGLLMNTPLAPAVRAGADVVHMIYLDPDLKDVPEQGHGTLDMINRFYALSFASQVNRNITNVRSINQAIELSQRVTSALKSTLRSRAMSDNAIEALTPIWNDYAKAADLNESAPITVHRFGPRNILEGGVLGLLDFDSARVSQLIDRGFEDAVTHDCIDSGCIFPTSADLGRVREICSQRASRA